MCCNEGINVEHCGEIHSPTLAKAVPRLCQKAVMSSAAKIPVIDVEAAAGEELARVARELVEAAVEHGFVYIRNRGADIPVDAVENAFDLVQSQPAIFTRRRPHSC